MKTSNCKTAQFPRIKRLTKYFCIIVVFCFFNLGALKAEDPIKETAVNNQQVETMSETTEIDSLRLQQVMERRSKIIQALANIIKKVSETTDSIVQNLK